jgi:hypothetical protein
VQMEQQGTKPDGSVMTSAVCTMTACNR